MPGVHLPTHRIAAACARPEGTGDAESREISVTPCRWTPQRVAVAAQVTAACGVAGFGVMSMAVSQLPWMVGPAVFYLTPLAGATSVCSLIAFAAFKKPDAFSLRRPHNAAAVGATLGAVLAASLTCLGHVSLLASAPMALSAVLIGFGVGGGRMPVA